MHARLLLSSSAVFLAVSGVGITFLPQELLLHVGASPEGASLRLVQLLGAALLGFAALNWMSKGAHIGGIYGRPLAMANFFHFAIGATALVRGTLHDFAVDIAVVAAIYTVFAVWFGLVLFTHPTGDPPS